MVDQAMEFVEVQAFKGSHKVYFKPTGEILDTFMNRWDALRVAHAVEKALQSMHVRNASIGSRCL